MTRHFWKMSGSGNDFVFIDGRTPELEALPSAAWVSAVCTAHTGVGADGVVVLRPSAEADFEIVYFNRDGSRGELCGNASLCATRLAVELGIAQSSGLRFGTDAGILSARIREGLPEIDLQPVERIQPDASGIVRVPGEERIGFANSGVPHLVLLTDDLAGIPLATRGPELRFHPTLSAGANVNWVAREPAGWAMRTYERGVEGETLACGTGSVAVATLLRAWGEAGDETSIRTRSGRQLTVRLIERAGRLWPSLRGEGRIVFEGDLREVVEGVEG